ncbi:MAG: hypothetical protein GC160_24845 [Acidobacteria bacterium]|nr:hypothetical protein [Acidobacteriota bacterium]
MRRRTAWAAVVAAAAALSACAPSADNTRPPIYDYGPGHEIRGIKGFEKSEQEKDVARLNKASLPLTLLWSLALAEGRNGMLTAEDGGPRVRYPVNPGKVTATVAVTAGAAEDDPPGAESMTYLLDSSTNNSIRFLDDRAGGLVDSLDLGATTFLDMALSPDQTTLLLVGYAADGSTEALLVDARKRAVLAAVPFPAEVNPHKAVFAPDGGVAYIAVWDGPKGGQFNASETRLVALDMATRTLRPGSVSLPGNTQVDDLAAHPSGELLFATTASFQLYFVDTRTMTVSQKLTGFGRLAVHPTGEKVYAGSGVRRIWVFDVATAAMEKVFAFEGEGVGDGDVLLKLDSSGAVLAATTRDPGAALVLLDSETGDRVDTLPSADDQHWIELY